MTIIKTLQIFFILNLLCFSAYADDIASENFYKLDANSIKNLNENGLKSSGLIRYKLRRIPDSKFAKYSKNLKIPEKTLREVVYQSEFLAIEGVGPKTAFLLMQCGIKGLSDLSKKNLQAVFKCIASKKLLDPLPPETQIKFFVDEAGSLLQSIPYKPDAVYRIEDMYGIDPEMIKKFSASGIKTNIDLYYELDPDRDEAARKFKSERKTIDRYAACADLTRLHEITPPAAYILFESGISGLEALQKEQAEGLLYRIIQKNDELSIFKVTPVLKDVEDWISAARARK
jgi:predicted flap endonuclease-1-like 5' DNA nuclease